MLAKRRGERVVRTELPEGVDCLVVAGIPGRPDPEGLAADDRPYPTSTADIVKLLREQGYRVEYEDPPERRARISYKANEWWIPVLLFAQGVAEAGVADVLVSIIRGYVPDFRRAKIHLKIGRADADGNVDWFEGQGAAPEVLDALREYFDAQD
jgi:hypothetical protein